MNMHSAHRDRSRIASAMVIDDHPLYGEALAQALARAFPDCDIRTATTLRDALDRLAGGFAPDLVVLDLKLPDVTGISGFLRLKDAVGEVPVLVTSALTSAEVVASLMEAGAAGFVPKDLTAEALQSALDEVRGGGRWLPVEYSAALDGHGARTGELRAVARRIADLTPQQTRIMKLICAGKPNKQIAYELDLAEATVKAHITAILRRLEVQNRTQAALLMEGATLGGAAPGDARAFLDG